MTAAVPARLAPEASSLVDRLAVLASAVVDDASYQALADVLTGAVEPMIRRVDATFNPILAAQREALAETRRQRDAVRDPLLAAKDTAKKALVAYQERLDAARARVQERILREAARREAERRALAGDSDVTGDRALGDAAFIVAAPTAALAALSRAPATVAEGVSTRRVWRLVRVLDARALRPEFLLPDEKKIRAVVRAMGPDAVASVSLDRSCPAIDVEHRVEVASRSTA